MTLKQQLDDEKRWKMRWRPNPLILFWLSYVHWLYVFGSCFGWTMSIGFMCFDLVLAELCPLALCVWILFWLSYVHWLYVFGSCFGWAMSIGFMCLDLVLQGWQSFLFYIYFVNMFHFVDRADRFFASWIYTPWVCEWVKQTTEYLIDGDTDLGARMSQTNHWVPFLSTFFNMHVRLSQTTEYLFCLRRHWSGC